MKFWALKSFEENSQIIPRMTELEVKDLDPGNILIKAQYSSVNFKDALGATGRGRIYKKTPIIGGVDVSGVVEESEDPRFKIGEQVLVTGCNLGETHDGGYSQYVRVSGDCVVPLPSNMTPFEAMALGTAGFTAAITLYRMLQNGQTPAHGPIVITGASGAVGSFAVSLFSKQGFEVIAISGKTYLRQYLLDLGARDVIAPTDLKLGVRPLEKVRFGGVVDNVGGELLAALISHVNLWGNVACIGLASAADLKTTVMPFILRGVSILGISSNNCPMPLRRELWERLAGIWRITDLNKIASETVKLSDLPRIFEKIIARKSHGHIVVVCEP